ncbi:hypothetical protein JQ615_02820 [Bradyrhizobium jicamae]|uniref:Uncharacterized protein n=1 Tax=Bradyrhizobium jicamae TaxID=280332 RepID=A0ABS5FC03_9BRAD|nr:hypothetical protein [Bradyrhizobium jicamae]MBR0794315.1 hypothetical protein [Bradyrhizobium jicamae]MBR0933465.1 hypothetical protein [Bradyrhizobium jicamae]
MGKARKTNEGGAKGGVNADDKSKMPPPLPSQQDDECDEDGDLATPKLDRYGNDDEPL